MAPFYNHPFGYASYLAASRLLSAHNPSSANRWFYIAQPSSSHSGAVQQLLEATRQRFAETLRPSQQHRNFNQRRQLPARVIEHEGVHFRLILLVVGPISHRFGHQSECLELDSMLFGSRHLNTCQGSPDSVSSINPKHLPMYHLHAP